MNDLRAPGALTRNHASLISAAHSLVGSAGMFGFRRLSETGRGFERAMLSRTDDLTIIAGQLDAAVEATLLELRAREMAGADSVPRSH